VLSVALKLVLASTVTPFVLFSEEVLSVVYVYIEINRGKFCLLGYNAVYAVDSYPTFWRNMYPS
jgi:hypothetical protein